MASGAAQILKWLEGAEGETIWDMTPEDLADALIGRVVVEVIEGDNVLVLDDGTCLEFEDTADCCAWFSADLKAGHLSDNAVTAVKVIDDSDDEYDESWTVHILAADDRIADLHVEGTESSGYYCHSINLVVKKPNEC